MADLISREAAIEALCEGCNLEFMDMPCEPKDCRIMERLEKLPSVDAVEVVRCKDCKHRGNTNVCPMTFSEGDDWWDKEDYTTDGGFCNKGEPKEDKP